MIIAEKKSKTEKGNFYSILQDTPNTFQLSIAVKDHVSHDVVVNPASVDVLEVRIRELEQELIDHLTEDDIPALPPPD